jgi:hypothetical protein
MYPPAIRLAFTVMILSVVASGPKQARGTAAGTGRLRPWSGVLRERPRNPQPRSQHPANSPYLGPDKPSPHLSCVMNLIFSSMSLISLMVSFFLVLLQKLRKHCDSCPSCRPWFFLFSIWNCGSYRQLTLIWLVISPVARPLPTQDNTNTEETHRHPRLEWDSNSRSQCLSGRRHFLP